MKKIIILLILILSLLIPSGLAMSANATVILAFRQLDASYWRKVYHHPDVDMDYWIIPDLQFDYLFYLSFDFEGYAYYDVLHSFVYTYYIPDGYSIEATPYPILIDYCMFTCGESSLYSRFDFDINYYEYEEGISCGLPNLKDWSSGTILYSACDSTASVTCWYGLNPAYAEKESVMDYYNWTDIWDINMNDVIDVGFTQNCITDASESMGCFIKQQIYYTIPLDNCTILPNHGLTMTTGEYINPPRPISNSSMTNYSIGQSDKSDIPSEGGGGASGTVGGGGLPISRIVDMELDKDIIRQNLKWMDTLIDVIKIIFSFVLIFFYMFQLLIIGYVMAQLIPGIFRKMQDIVKNGLMMGRRE